MESKRFFDFCGSFDVCGVLGRSFGWSLLGGSSWGTDGYVVNLPMVVGILPNGHSWL